MTRNEFIQQVALRMDEVSPDITIEDLTIDGSDGNPLYTLIDGLVDAGALELFSAAPYWRLPQRAFSYSATAADNQIIVEDLPDALGDYSCPANGDTGTVTKRKVIRLKVPDDFLRVAEIGCSEFVRPITEVFPEQSEAGRRQHNRYLMGKEFRPVGVISHGIWNSAQCREIDCYSLSNGTTVTASNGKIEASYIPKPEMPEIDSQTDITTVVPAVLIDAMVWLVAARSFGARGDANHAAICQQNAQNLLV